MAALDKVTYVDGTTVIRAKNMNDIQNAILDLIKEGLVFKDTNTDGNITVSMKGVS